MINLLPPDTKSQIVAGRTNRLLFRYNIMVLIAIAFLLAAIGLVYFYIGNARASAERSIEENILKAGDYSSVEAEANAFKQNLASVKQILDNDVAYTKVILEIASVLPSGIVLDTLNLDSATFGTPTTLTANARDYQTVLTLKDSLQKSSLFSDVSIQTISSGEAGSYPITATLSVTIRKDAAR